MFKRKKIAANICYFLGVDCTYAPREHHPVFCRKQKALSNRIHICINWCWFILGICCFCRWNGILYACGFYEWPQITTERNWFWIYRISIHFIWFTFHWQMCYFQRPLVEALKKNISECNIAYRLVLSEMNIMILFRLTLNVWAQKKKVNDFNDLFYAVFLIIDVKSTMQNAWAMRFCASEIWMESKTTGQNYISEFFVFQVVLPMKSDGCFEHPLLAMLCINCGDYFSALLYI